MMFHRTWTTQKTCRSMFCIKKSRPFFIEIFAAAAEGKRPKQENLDGGAYLEALLQEALLALLQYRHLHI